MRCTEKLKFAFLPPFIAKGREDEGKEESSLFMIHYT